MNASADYALGRALRKAGKQAEAVSQFAEAERILKAERDQEDAGLYTINGIRSLRAGNVEDAVESLRKAVARKPDYPEANYYLGIALAQSGDAIGSTRAFETALERRPKSAEIHYNFGMALWKMRRAAEAIRELRQATELRPEDGLAHCALGKALLSEGLEQEGQRELDVCQPGASTKVQ